MNAHLVALGVALWLTTSLASAAAERPNILVVYTDDQSHRTVGCYSEAYPWVKTPNIDRLAKEGVRFVSGYCGTWCAPSRAMFLTGLQPHAIRGLKFGKNPHSTYDPAVCRFWPAELRKAGYRTAQIGKWHLSTDAGHGRDWDHSVVWFHSDPKAAGGYYRNQKLSFDGGPLTAVGGYSTDNYTRYALDFIRRPHDKPWLLWLCYDAVHSPYLPAERHQSRYTADEPVATPADIFPPRPTKPAYMHRYGVWKPGPDGVPVNAKNRPLPEAVRQYNRAVLGLDEGVGRLLDALEQTGQLANTLVVFTSDQGFAWGQHGFEWKVAPYDANLRAPFIVRLPGRAAAGKVCRHPVAMLDLIPTIFALAGTPTPWPLHGHDLSPILKNPDAPWPHPVMLEFFGHRFGGETDRALTGNDGLGGVPWWLSLRQGKYKYIRTLMENEIEELYDLESDPEELTNLALVPEHRATLEDFRARLEAELKRTNAGLLKNLPPPRNAKP
jgi:arylsulfatase A-like enzyme